MIDRSKPQPPSIRLFLLFAALGVSVFLWGLGYKLSLYETHPSNNHRIPKAKLLSRDDDPSAHKGVRPDPVKSASPHAGMYVTHFGLLPVVMVETLRARGDWQYLSIPKLWCAPSHVTQDAFHLRPPPILV